MEAALAAKLIVEVGLPAAEQIIRWIEEGKNLNSTDIAALRALGAKSADDYLAEAGGAPTDKPTPP